MIVHRDLRPENIYLIDGITIKIINFGSCADIDHNKKISLYAGSAYYLAPEIVEGHYD